MGCVGTYLTVVEVPETDLLTTNGAVYDELSSTCSSYEAGPETLLHEKVTDLPVSHERD